MIKWIRWSGLISFIILFSALAAFYILAAGPLIKYSIETFGSDALGAKVDVEEVSLGFDPLALHIKGVQVTDPDDHMSNMVSFDTAVANLELFPLLLGKAIIPELTLEGLAFATPRTVSGALAKKETSQNNTEKEDSKPSAEDKAAAKQSDDVAEQSSSQLPSADEIIDREPLLTVERGEALELSLSEQETAIEEALSKLPTEQSLKQYEADLKTILSGKFKSASDFKARKKAFDTLKQQMKTDQKNIKLASRAIKGAKSDLTAKWKALKAAPALDLKNLKGKYTLDAAGSSNLTALLFGKEAGGYAETALEYYEKVRPLLVDDEAQKDKQAQQEKRLEGEFIHFDTDRPLPDFWIKTLAFSVQLQVPNANTESLGSMMVSITDITHQQDVINQPMRLTAVGENLTSMQSLNLDAIFDHRNSANNGLGKDSYTLNIEKWQLKELKLGVAGLKLNRAQLNVQSKGELVKGDMQVQANSVFSQATFASKDRTVLAKEMVAALKHIDRFTVDASANGKLSSPKTSIKSDLDNQLKSAFNKRIKERQAQLERKLKDKINEKLLSFSGPYKEKLKALNLADGNLSDKKKDLQKLAKSEIADYQKQLKAEAKAKANKEKAAAKAKARKEKEKIEAQAKAKADKKKKELEKKARDKLKKLF